MLAATAALPAQARDLVIYGEPTLKPVLTSLGTLWRAKGNGGVHVFVAPTDLSFEQIARETRCDVIFALAGPVTDAAEERELFDADSKIDAFGNSLVLVARQAAPASATDVRAMVAGKRLAIANPGRDVAGSYGVMALRAAGVDPAGKGVMVAENAAGVLQMLADGNADVGVVYASDAAANPGFKVLARFDTASHPPIVYVAAQAAHADDDSDSEGFIDFLTTPEAKAAIVAAGLFPALSKTAQTQPGSSQ
ncbi:MAG TPA: molybdate ABC transporter substrate-binding protein [Xanthobacteraceae bacterium]|nr:molybdate ABC transporter substrate-binding protein [Xanthobacteraceae bacterium]